MYFITCFSNFDSEYIEDSRTFGFYENFETCKTALQENWCDMHELYYDFAVIELIDEGIHPRTESETWFRWNNERGGFFETEKPDWSSGWVNFALG